jgi:hypothetical protein
VKGRCRLLRLWSRMWEKVVDDSSSGLAGVWRGFAGLEWVSCISKCGRDSNGRILVKLRMIGCLVGL